MVPVASLAGLVGLRFLRNAFPEVDDSFGDFLPRVRIGFVSRGMGCLCLKPCNMWK